MMWFLKRAPVVGSEKAMWDHLEPCYLALCFWGSRKFGYALERCRLGHARDAIGETGLNNRGPGAWI